MRALREAAHTARKEDYRLFAAAERKSTKFILAVVELYTTVNPQALLAHHQKLCVGLHATDVINLQNEMQTYHEDMEVIPTYVNKL